MPPDEAAPNGTASLASDEVGPIAVTSGGDGVARRRHSRATAAAAVVVTIVAGSVLFLSGWALGRVQANQPGTPAADARDFTAFWDAYDAIIGRYAGGPVDHKAIIEGAIKGMFDAVGDPYSLYLSPDQFRQSLQGLSGQFEGIGAEIGTEDAAGRASSCTTLSTTCRLVVTSPIDGSPAAAAGIRTGDVIIAVNGTSVDGLTVAAATGRIRGPRGTKVTLTIARGTASPFTVTITRDIVVEPEISSKTIGAGTVGYIKLAQFSDNSSVQFRTALAADVSAGLKRIVVDLRGDPGGFVTAARTIASQFIPNGPIFIEVDAQGNRTTTNAEPGGVATDPSIRVVVLIDHNSASASEIVAGALQARGRAKLVGETSFGKGTVQQWTELSDNFGGYRLTVARWLTPDGRSINHVGLTPDVPVTISQNVPVGTDPILDRALQVLGAPGSSGLLDEAA